MWFGDLVTMRWWDDLWLNESFATYVSVLCQSQATRWTNAWTTFANVEKTWAYRQDQLPTTHPIVADIRDLEDVEVNFDGITYAKGASRPQAARRVGRARQLLRGDPAATSSGTRGATRRSRTCSTILEETSGRDLRAWSKEWLETAGVNILRPDVHGRRRRQLRVVRGAAVGRPRTGRPCARTASRSASTTWTHDGLVRRERVEIDVSGASHRRARAGRQGVPGPRPGQRRRPRPTPRSGWTSGRWRTVGRQIGTITDSLPRALCWSAAWDMTRDARVARPRLRRPRAARGRLGVRHRGGAGVAAPGDGGAVLVHRPGPPGGRAGRAWPPGPASSCAPPTRAATASCPGRGPSPPSHAVTSSSGC